MITETKCRENTFSDKTTPDTDFECSMSNALSFSLDCELTC